MTTINDIQHELARRDFSVFLDFVYIQKISDGNESGGLTKFEKWDHLMDVVDSLQNNRRIVWVKARQLGCSWTIAAYNLWTAMFMPGSRIVQFAEKEDKAKELLRKVKFVYRNLPPALQVPVKSLDNQLIMEFPSVESDITCYPSTPDAAIGLTATRVWFDEFDFHDHGAEALDATAPLVNDIGGQIIITSTINSERAVEGSTIQTLFMKGEEKGWKPIFYGVLSRPDRDQEWFDQAELAAADIFAFRKHYPRNIREALDPPDTLVVFRRNVLDAMKNECREPVDSVGPVNIFQYYTNNKRYVAACDVAHGVGADYSVLVVMDAMTGYVVASYMDNLITPEDFAEVCMDVLENYRWPLWGIEENDWGRSVIGRAIEREYPHLYYRDDEKPGWETGPRTRFPMWSELIEAVHNRLITIPDQTGLDQFYHVIRNAKKGGRPDHQEGGNDDFPTACAIAWQMRKEQSVYSMGTGQKPVSVNRWSNARRKTNSRIRR